MDSKNTEQHIRRIMAAWDGAKPAPVSPFLWTRIRTELFEGGEVRPAALKPAYKLVLGLWMLLFLAQSGVWIAGSTSRKDESTPDRIREVFFSDESPYAGSQ